jgi:superfamily I DNA/RNA helicase
MRSIKLYGPPGTGKTRRLTALAIKAVEIHGPDRVMATTFTRAAATELKERIVAALGYQASLPNDAWQRRRALDRLLPWVGTTHSLALKLAGYPKVLAAKDYTDFSKSLGGKTIIMPEADDLEGYGWLEPGRDEIEQALSLYSGARHRQESVEAAYRRARPLVNLQRAQHIVDAYEHFKADLSKIDFEDMLARGMEERPPVSVLLADEVQDNSPLLWDVIDAWSAEHDVAMAGDPWQAIYLFSGASPELFVNHPGELHALGDSHRLTAESAQRAQRILRQAGHADGEWLGTWTGIGQGSGDDGSEFWLARTQRLIKSVTDDFELLGIPYGYIRGGGPLETKAADAFRALMTMRERGALQVSVVAGIAEQMEPNWLPHGEKARLHRLVQSDPEMIISDDDLRQAWGMGAQQAPYHLKRGDYFLRVLGKAGREPFVFGPKLRVGTIHSAKGKEADTVHLVTSWGTLPYQASLASQAGRQAEGCVAYVGATRHRNRLLLEQVREGMPYEGLYA